MCPLWIPSRSRTAVTEVHGGTSTCAAPAEAPAGNLFRSAAINLMRTCIESSLCTDVNMMGIGLRDLRPGLTALETILPRSRWPTQQRGAGQLLADLGSHERTPDVERVFPQICFPFAQGGTHLHDALHHADIVEHA